MEALPGTHVTRYFGDICNIAKENMWQDWATLDFWQSAISL